MSCLNDGSVKIIDCTPENRLAKVDSFIPFRRKTALTSVCVLNETIISGSDTGSIVSIAPSASRDQRSKVLATDLMGVRCLAPCGLNIFVSGHSTGQIHMWDLREEPASPGLPHQPVITKAITSLNNSITSLGTHTAQPNILAVGTGDGSVIFVDIRHTVEALPVALKVSKEPIDEVIDL